MSTGWSATPVIPWLNRSEDHGSDSLSDLLSGLEWVWRLRLPCSANVTCNFTTVATETCNFQAPQTRCRPKQKLKDSQHFTSQHPIPRIPYHRISISLSQILTIPIINYTKALSKCLVRMQRRKGVFQIFSGHLLQMWPRRTMASIQLHF